MLVLVAAVTSTALPATTADAYTSANWTSGFCTSVGGTQSYSVSAKQASATMTYNNGGGDCYVSALASCQRASGDINTYRSAGNTIAQGVTTYDCDNNGTYNFKLTNNATETRTYDQSSGCAYSC